MQDYNTIVGVITMRLNECSYPIILSRYHIGSGTAQKIVHRFEESGFTLEDLKSMNPTDVENYFYPKADLRKKDVPMPDYQYWYNRIHTKGSRVNIAYCWLEYRRDNPNGYGQTQFYEYYNRFVDANNLRQKGFSMAVERVPGEKMYIDWVGDQPELLTDPETGELKKVHIFATTLGTSSYIYAEVFIDEKLQSFIAGTVHALRHYGAVPKYLVPDNLKAAIKKHTKDELVLQSSYSDLEDFYDTIVVPPPARKPKGKATVEGHVRYLETHLLEKLKEQTFTSLDQINSETKKIVADLNSRNYQGESYSRKDSFEKYDKPCMKPLPGDNFTVCDYRYIAKISDNYHIEYDNHYYSVFYSYCGKPAILKATLTEIRICDQYNRLICKHQRSYQNFPKYITDDSHMPAEHAYYKEVNSKNGSYYRNWAKSFGPCTEELIDRILKSSKHEEQSYNSCAGVLHKAKEFPHGLVEEASRECIEMNSCIYSSFKKVLEKLKNRPLAKPNTLPTHSNIRGKGFYK